MSFFSPPHRSAAVCCFLSIFHILFCFCLFVSFFQMLETRYEVIERLNTLKLHESAALQWLKTPISPSCTYRIQKLELGQWNPVWRESVQAEFNQETAFSSWKRRQTKKSAVHPKVSTHQQKLDRRILFFLLTVYIKFSEH